MKVIVPTPARPSIPDRLEPRSRWCRVLGFLALSALVTSHGSAAFWNLTGTLTTHDPSIIKENSTWWIFETGVGLPVKFSSNGTAWSQGVRIFANDLAWWNTYVPNGSRDPKPDVAGFDPSTL